MVVAPGCALVDSNCAGTLCGQSVDLLASCTCKIDGGSTTCDAGTCSLHHLPAGTVLVVPLDWNTIGADASGLTILGVGADLIHATLLFDGVPASGCTFLTQEIQCTSLPQSVQSLSFSYPSGRATFLTMTMSNLACEATARPCQG